MLVMAQEAAGANKQQDDWSDLEERRVFYAVLDSFR